MINSPLVQKMEKTASMEKAVRLCETTTGSSPQRMEVLKESGSARSYFRATMPDSTYVICVSENVAENRTFIRLANYLLSMGLNVPEVLAVTDGCDAYMLEDLGDTDLLGVIRGLREGEMPPELLEMVLDQLVRFQRLPREEWRDIVEFPPLDGSLVKYDFQYAVNNLLEPLDVNYDASRLSEDFSRLEKKLLDCPEKLWGLMYRDFQSRNVMLKGGKPYLIDFQSARFGPGIYDVVSFAWQAKAAFSPLQREEIISTYVRKLRTAGIEAEDEILGNIRYWAVFRILQTLGAYGLRGLKEGKRHFIESIPAALQNILLLFEEGDMTATFPELYSALSYLREKWNRP